MPPSDLFGTLMGWITEYGPIALVLAAVAGAASIAKFLMIRSREQQRHDFEAFHKLIKELVEKDGDNLPKLDRQAAIVFELGNFPRYFRITKRILSHFRQRVDAEQYALLRDEIDRTLNFIARRQSWKNLIPFVRSYRA
jgi:hypothetical protein